MVLVMVLLLKRSEGLLTPWSRPAVLLRLGIVRNGGIRRTIRFLMPVPVPILLRRVVPTIRSSIKVVALLRDLANFNSMDRVSRLAAPSPSILEVLIVYQVF